MNFSERALPRAMVPGSDVTGEQDAKRSTSAGGWWWLPFVALITGVLCVPFLHSVFFVGR